MHEDFPSQEELLALFNYSEDGYLFWKVRHNNRIPADLFAGAWTRGRLKISIKGAMYFAHHIVWVMHKGGKPVPLDHKDRNPGNNRIDNLRPASPAENAQNRRANSNSTSRYTGVSWDTRDRCWVAQINLNGKRAYLGSFADELAARQAYLTAKAKLHTFQPTL